MAVTIGESPGERAKRYLVQLLKDEYGASYVYEKAAPIGRFTQPTFEVEMGADTYDRLGWAVCHAVVRSAVQHGSKENAHENAGDLASHLVETVREGVRRGLPVISGDGPPWYDVAASATKVVQKPENVTVEVRFDFSTGLVPGGV